MRKHLYKKSDIESWEETVKLVRNHHTEDMEKILDMLKELNLPFKINWDFLAMEYSRLSEGKNIRNRSRKTGVSSAEKKRRYKRFGTK
jgi:hypothetical protein